jgi:hypothetical protein
MTTRALKDQALQITALQVGVAPRRLVVGHSDGPLLTTAAGATAPA